jgi:hypothetical protein
MLGMIAGTGCRRDAETKSQRAHDAAPAAAETAKTDADQAPDLEQALQFGSETPDGRQTDLADYDETALANRDLTKVVAGTKAYYNLPTVSSILWRNPPDQVALGSKFTNLMESIPRSDAVALLDRACQEAVPGITKKDCVARMSSQSPFVAFELKTPAPVANDNDVNHFYNYLNGLLPVVPVTVNGVSSYMFACNGCHVTTAAVADKGGANSLLIDFRGVNAYGDGLANNAVLPLFNKGKSVVDSPADAIWSTSPRVKAGGYLLAQLKKWQVAYGTNYHLSTSEIETGLKKGNVQRAVDAGWVAAFATFATTAGTYANSQPQDLSEATMITRTQRVTAESFLPGGSRYAVAQTATPTEPNALPLRPMRSVVSNMLASGASIGLDGSFAFGYLTGDCANCFNDAAVTAVNYLAGATMFSVPFPASIDSALATAWYPGKTTAQVKDEIYSRIKRAFTRNYAVLGPAYHQLRYRSTPIPVTKDYAVRMGASHAQAASAYIQASCASGCHLNGLPAYSADWGKSPAGAGCNFTAESSWTRPPCEVGFSMTANLFPYNGSAHFTSTASTYAQNMAMAIDTSSAVMNGSPNLFGIQFRKSNDSAGAIQHEPKRNVPNGLGLTTASYASVADFLKATRPAARWAILSGKVTASGTAIRGGANPYSLDINGDGVVDASNEPLVCDTTKTFLVNGVSTTCEDLLHTYGVPRLINDSNSVMAQLHASITRPAAYLGAGATQAQVDALIADVASYLYGLKVGRFVIYDDAATSNIKDIILKGSSELSMYTDQCSATDPMWKQMCCATAGPLDIGCSSGVLTTTTPSFLPPAGTYTSAQTVTIASDAGATIYYTTNGTSPSTSSTLYQGPFSVSANTTVKALAVKSGQNNSATGQVAYTVNITAMQPTFSPNTGVYATAQNVTLSSATTGASIYYTLDGTTPTTSSTKYTGTPVAVASTKTIKAIAVASGMGNSTVGQADITIGASGTATPTFTFSNYMPGAKSISISTTTPGATIYYTTNGSTPTTSSSVFNGMLMLGSGQTVKAVAKAAGVLSDVGIATVPN